MLEGGGPAFEIPTFGNTMKLLVLFAAAVILTACQKKPENLGYRIVSTRPHDPECYTQGLEFSGKRLFESSGGYGNSNVREVDPADGKVLRKRPMAKNLFAEGITILNNELWVLSWKENTVTVLDPDTFKFLRSYNYQGEGWGLTHDGKSLIMSDGTSKLKFIDPKDFSVQKTLEVKKSGRPVELLNELEVIDGEIFANIYTTGEIVRISPQDGRVTGTLDLSGLRNQLPRPNKADVLNGIARDPATGNLLVTGKLWPKMFEIQIEGR
jgi:glutamine cyclotransferase